MNHWVDPGMQRIYRVYLRLVLTWITSQLMFSELGFVVFTSDGDGFHFLPHHSIISDGFWVWNWHFFLFFFKFVSLIVYFCCFFAFFHQNFEVCPLYEYHSPSHSQVLGKRWNLSSRRYGFDEMNLFVKHFRLNLMIFCTGRIKFKPDRLNMSCFHFFKTE